MALVKKYTGITLNGAASPGTLVAHATTPVAVYTNGIPVCGARMIVFRIKASNNNLPSAWGINIGNDAARTGVFSSITGAGYASVVGNIGLSLNGGGGNTVSAAASANQGRFHHAFAQLTLTPKVGATPANDTTGVTIDADVWYDGDADSIMLEAGQQNYTVLTT